MVEMRDLLKNVITKRLCDAPESPAKGELIEELTDNLFCRYSDLVEAGIDPGEAQTQALDALGDTGELVEYLKSLEPDEPLPRLTLDPDKEDGGQLSDMMKNVEEMIRSAMNQAKSAIDEAKEQLSDAGVFRWNWKSDDGKMEVSVDPAETCDVETPVVEEPVLEEDDGHAEAISMLEEEISAQEAAITAAEEELAALEEQLSQLEDELSELEEQLSELEDDMEGSDRHVASVERRIAAKERQIERKQAQIDKTRENIDAKEEEISELEDELDELQTELEELEEDGDASCSGGSGFNIDIKFDAVTRKLDDAAKKIKDAFRNRPFTVGVDVREDGCSIGVNPHEKGEKDVIYGVGYDREKGGFFAQWGEYKGDYSRRVEDGPVCSEALRGIVVQTVSGDVTFRMTEHPEDDVIIDGDVDDLDVRRSDDGVLTITPGKTASSSFFFGRGLSSADVTLSLPRRAWEFLRVSTVSGDISIEGDHEVGLVAVKTTSGDLEGSLPRCGELRFKSVSGDLDWRGNAAQVDAATTSGDLTVTGNLGEVRLASVSGDLRLDGAVTTLDSGSTSGDLWVRSFVQPERLNVISRAGDADIRLPADSVFTVRFHTAGGKLRTDFFDDPAQGREITLSNNGGAAPVYELNTTGGDVRLKKN